MRSDEELVGDHLGGDEQAFGVLVDRYRPSLVRYLGNGVRVDQSLAENIVNEVFAKVLEKIGRFDCEKKFEHWLYCIADNLGKAALAKKIAA